MKNTRAIEFRVWDKHNKWVSPSYYRISALGEILHHDNSQYSNVVLQQFTGISDKNGKPIFEGDLVKFEIKGVAHGPEREYLKKAEVWFDEEIGAWSFGRFTNGRGDPFSYSLMDRLDLETLEIVGNICEK